MSFCGKRILAACFCCMSLSVLLPGCMSFEDVKRYADQGNNYNNGIFQYRTAIMLRDGNGVKANKKMSWEYMNKAVRSGYLYAAEDLIKDILCDTHNDRSRELLDIYASVFRHERSFAAIHEWNEACVRRMMNPAYFVQYTRYLTAKKYEKSAYTFKKEALKYLDNKIFRTYSDAMAVTRCKAEIKDIYTPFELSEENRILSETIATLRENITRAIANHEQLLADKTVKFSRNSSNASNVVLSGNLSSGVTFRWVSIKLAKSLLQDCLKKASEIENSLNRFIQISDPAVRKKKRPELARSIEVLAEDVKKNTSFLDAYLHDTQEHNGDFYGFSSKYENVNMIFASDKHITEKNKSDAVLVQCKFELGKNIPLQTVLQKILRDNPGAKHKSGKKSINRAPLTLKNAVVVNCVQTQYITTAWTEKKEWCLTCSSARYKCSFTAFGNQMLSDVEKDVFKKQLPSEEPSPVIVLVSDRKAVQLFSNLKAKEIQSEKAAEEKARQEQLAKELDSI